MGGTRSAHRSHRWAGPANRARHALQMPAGCVHSPHTQQGAGHPPNNWAGRRRGCIRLNILRAAMADNALSSSTQPGAGRVDPVASERALRRLALGPQSPWLHDEVARRMGERLSWIKRQPERVVDWSGAAGSCRALLAAAYPRALCQTVADPALGLVGDDAHGAPWWRRWLLGAAPAPVAWNALPHGSAGLLWSNMRLHFAPDPLPLLRAWRQAIAPDGFLMFSTLGPGSLGLLREVYAAAGWGPAHAPFVDMHDLGDMLVETGFAEPVMDQETLTLQYANVDALLAELRTLGANLAPNRFAGFRGRQWRQALYQGISQRTNRDGRISLQFELVYGHAFRAADAGPRVEAQTQIGLDELKLMLRNPRLRK
ncbi:biotin synthase [Ideonella sp. DXS29W]|uniref:Biotin synthase n=1 Tax=Ideonella lacteola TaxID=2984193 RepID=A0ABU9BPK7_9BURK